MRKNLFSPVFLTCIFLQSAAVAQSPVAADLIAQIQSDGYTVTEIRRSWLGRIVITAKSDDDLREVVLDRTSGEVLRDQTFAIERRSKGDPARAATPEGNKPGPNGPGGPGGNGGHGRGG